MSNQSIQRRNKEGGDGDFGSGRLTVTILGLYDRNDVGKQEEEEVFGSKIVSVALYMAGEKVTGRGDRPLVVKTPLSLLYSATAYFVVGLEEEAKDAAEANSSLAMTACALPDHAVLVDHVTTVSLPLQAPNDTNALHNTQRALRVQLLLEGPYRPEISKLLHVSHRWFTFVDCGTDAILDRLKKVSRWVMGLHPFTKIFAVAAGGLILFPLVVLSVVLSPVVVGTALLFLPLLLPVFVLASFGFFSALAAAGTCYLSSRHGRQLLQHLLWTPLLHPVLTATRTGQQFIYQTGPRPSLVALCRLVLPDGKWSRLLCSLAMDFIGSLSYLIPFVAEITDVVWAPLHFLLLLALYGTQGETLFTASLWKYFYFLEEFLPFTDFVPSATLAWAHAEWFSDDQAAQFEILSSSSSSHTNTLRTRDLLCDLALSIVDQKNAAGATPTAMTTAATPLTTPTPLTVNDEKENEKKNENTTEATMTRAPAPTTLKSNVVEPTIGNTLDKTEDLLETS